MSTDVTSLTVAELQAALADGTTSVEITQAYLDRIEAADGELAGEDVELFLGHRQPGQVRQVRDFVAGERAHAGAELHFGGALRPVLGRERDPATLRGAVRGRSAAEPA